MKPFFTYTICCLLAPGCLPAQESARSAQGSAAENPAPAPVLWHGQQRSLRYRPEGGDFVILNGERRFNRALYGTNTAFRVEAGDLPEFALYMPGLGGNLQFGLIGRGEQEHGGVSGGGPADSSKALIRAANIRAVYRPGSMLYEVRDAFLGKGALYLKVLALAGEEGMILQLRSSGVPAGTRLFSIFGGASGKKFSRDGDIGADPESSFYLKPGNCEGNQYRLGANSFHLLYGDGKSLEGIFPSVKLISLADGAPAVTDTLALGDGKEYYFLLRNGARPGGGEPINSGADPAAFRDPAAAGLSALFAQAESAREKIANRVRVNTPDPYINTLGGALGIAADAIWEDPSYLHGAVAWRMRLNAWRGPYVADPLGWHDRARMHFSSYALSQITAPETGPVVADTMLHLARQLEKIGTSLFSSGYISRNPGGDIRPHHYDMNLVFIDELLDHFCWTGDTSFVRKMWPVIRRHLAWEKRNFDADGDGLYDAYCCIWASDALQYSGGGVTHSSAYNYRANKIAAELAVLIGEDPRPYRKEADHILHAIGSKLWMPRKGWYAEYIDWATAGLHPAAGLWTIYHAIDSKVPDAFQAWQALRYIDTEIPHIPIRAKGLEDTSLYTISTTNWLPYTWSINNVAMAEVLHTSLAYWQGGRSDEAYTLWKSALVESMYLGASPGNFQQLSFYDAIRGELYRDFADPIGMAARSLVEGLFGIHPDALHDTLTVAPGWPMEWRYASLHIPDVDFGYVREGNEDQYTLTTAFLNKMNLRLQVRARMDQVQSVTVNGLPVKWTSMGEALAPTLQILVPPAKADHLVPLAKANHLLPPAKTYHITITWKGKGFEEPLMKKIYSAGEELDIRPADAVIKSIYDPQEAVSGKSFPVTVRAEQGNKTIFMELQQGEFHWWQPIPFQARPAVGIRVAAGSDPNSLMITVDDHTSHPHKGSLVYNFGAGKYAGLNKICWLVDGALSAETDYISWFISNPPGTHYDTVSLSSFFNDRVDRIFLNEYRSPRPASPTLELPWQGIGNWCYPLVNPEIDDSGLRRMAGDKHEILLPDGIPLATPGDGANKEAQDGVHNGPNIAFTSRWNNYPDSISVPLSGKASHIYFLLAGTTDPMQSRITNGRIRIEYKDGPADELELNNPTNWWPIEQDYYEDGFAFSTGAPRPLRVSLKTGQISDKPFPEHTIKGFTGTGIDGGAATVLDLPLHPDRQLDRLVLTATAGDVIIGLMSVTLVRPAGP